jgi:trans-L-3-hydroxyproline dehydratase
MPPEHRRGLRLIDTHYGGDVSRIVVGGVTHVPGDTVLAKREWLQRDGDALRRLLLGSPYGEPSMCANVIVDTTLQHAEAGYVIMEAMGYPHFSGSNSICVTTALLESGHIPFGPPGHQTVHLEAPAGLIRAEVEHDGRHVHSVTLACDPSWVVERGRTAELPEFGTVTYDVVWSGCFYAVVDAEAQGFALTEAERHVLRDFGLELCLVAGPELDLVHPDFGDTGHLSFVNFSGPVLDGDDGPEARAATYVHPGVVCRCPTGTGTAARLALLAEDGEVHVGDHLTTISPTGSRMVGRVDDRLTASGQEATAVSVTGQAFTLGITDLVVNLDDDLAEAEGIWDLLAVLDPGQL